MNRNLNPQFLIGKSENNVHTYYHGVAVNGMSQSNKFVHSSSMMLKLREK
jgi:hypothetical protein